ncbi:MAG: hypothetical protein WC939_03150, partial [Acholeplasmataceae bacterium]
LLTNPNFDNGITGWNIEHSSIDVNGGVLTITPLGTASYAGFYQTIQWAAGEEFYNKVRVRVTTPNIGYIDFNISADGNKTYIPTIYNPIQNQWYEVSDIYTPNVKGIQLKIHAGKNNTITNEQFVDERMEVDYHISYNVSDMKRKGIKDDNGIPFANLTNEEIKSQLDIWVENGFPTVVEKLVSKSDNLFNGKFNTLSSLDSENLVVNGDLLIDSNSDGIPDGFSYTNATNETLSGGIAKFTATEQYARILLSNPTNIFNSNDVFYNFARFKSSRTNVTISTPIGTGISHSGSGNFEFLSTCGKFVNIYTIAQVTDRNTSDWTEIEVDYIGAFNVTDLVSRGILPSGLSDDEYKEMIDKAMFANVPLRETNYIAVEPSKAYKLIKVSSNEVTHKVIEYTTDNQIVKVTPVVYTTNKFIFTTHALTDKIKIVSDMLERPVNLVHNGDLLIDSDSNGIPDGFSYTNATNQTLSGGIATFTATGQFGRIQANSPNSNGFLGDKVYYFARFKTNSPDVRLTFGQGTTVSHPGNNNYEFVSNLDDMTLASRNLQVSDYRTSGWTPIEVDYMGIINITDFKKAGVKDDNGSLFSRLTNDEIKDQMDIWVKVGFPDHVIAALYPDGVDSAIALKYNDADDVFRPQQIDELPLNLTLRSGEYWQDGYVVKQNGNAEYYPLDTKFSAWNYGQLEAVYTSGVPADFDIKYAQNTAAQVKTTQEFLVEARELIGNGNKGDMDVIPPIPTTDGTYTLKVTITGGIPVFSWVANE